MENINQIIEQIKPAMEKMAEQLGVGAEFLWQVFLKQQLVDGFMGLGGIMLGVILISFVIWISKKFWKLSCDNEDELVIVIIMMLDMFCVLIAGGFIIAGFVEAINHFINPEYQAIKDIFEFIKGASN